MHLKNFSLPSLVFFSHNRFHSCLSAFLCFYLSCRFLPSLLAGSMSVMCVFSALLLPQSSNLTAPLLQLSTCSSHSPTKASLSASYVFLTYLMLILHIDMQISHLIPMLAGLHETFVYSVISI